MSNKGQMKSILIPTISEETDKGYVKNSDIFSNLLNNDRVIFLLGEINTEMSSVICAQLLHLNSIDSKKPIFLYINSGGGSISAGLSIVDTMGIINAPVHTIVFGIAASMAAIIFVCGIKRLVTWSSQIMIHQPLISGVAGQQTDIEIIAKSMRYLRKFGEVILSKQTGQSIEQIRKDTERDTYFAALDAVEYGLAHEIKHSNLAFHKEDIMKELSLAVST